GSKGFAPAVAAAAAASSRRAVPTAAPPAPPDDKRDGDRGKGDDLEGARDDPGDAASAHTTDEVEDAAVRSRLGERHHLDAVRCAVLPEGPVAPQRRPHIVA